MRINISFVDGSRRLHTRVQSIAGELQCAPTPQRVRCLTRELDATSCDLKEMQKKASAVFGQSQSTLRSLEEEIVHLYGRIHDLLISRQVSQIEREALLLKKSLNEGHPRARDIDMLRRHISQFLKDHRPCVSDRRVIADAKRTLEEAKRCVQGEVPPPIAPCHDTGASLGGEDYEPLFEIAVHLYHARLKEAKSLYHQLPYALKKEVDTHLKTLAAVLFEDREQTLQALIATVNQIVGNGELYPTPSEIDEIFLGLKIIQREEAKAPAPFSHRSAG